MAIIDFHCHLDLYEEPEQIVRQAIDEGVYILSVTTTPSAFPGTVALARGSARIRTAVGLHPELAAQRRRELPLFREYVNDTGYVGEVGLDGSRPHRSSLDAQAEVLCEILDICAAVGGRTISLHSRGAAEMLLDLLEFEPNAGRFVLHWFSATPALIQRAADIGCWFSINSNMITSRTGRTAIAAMPSNRLLPETDGPFGQIDEGPPRPGDGGRLYSDLAAMTGETPLEVERRLTNNFRQLVALSVLP